LTFLFRLARELGVRDPRELLALDGDVWAGWLAYSAVEPFGPTREDLRAAEIACMVAAGGGVRLRPGDVFASLAESRPRGRVAPTGSAAGRIGGLTDTMAALSALCPALTPIEAD
jgi:hypothetical protein